MPPFNVDTQVLKIYIVLQKIISWFTLHGKQEDTA